MMDNKNLKLIALINNDFRDVPIDKFLKEFNSNEMDNHFISFKSLVTFMNIKCDVLDETKLVKRLVGNSSISPLSGIGLYSSPCFYGDLEKNVFLNWRGILATLLLHDIKYFKNNFPIIEYIDNNKLLSEDSIKINAIISDSAKNKDIGKTVNYNLNGYEWIFLVNTNNLIINDIYNKIDTSKMYVLNRRFSLGLDVKHPSNLGYSNEAYDLMINLSLGNVSLDKSFDDLKKFKKELSNLKNINLEKSMSLLCDAYNEFNLLKHVHCNKSFNNKKEGMSSFNLIVKDFFGYDFKELINSKFINSLLLDNNMNGRNHYFGQISSYDIYQINFREYMNDIFAKISNEKNGYCDDICNFSIKFKIPFLKFIEDGFKKKYLDEIALRLNDGKILVDFLKLNSSFYDKSLLEEPLSNKKNGDTLILDLIKSSKSHKDVAIEWLSLQNINLNIPNKNGITPLMHIDKVPRHNKFKGLIEQYVLADKIPEVINKRIGTNKI